MSTAAVLLAVALWIGPGPVGGAGARRDAVARAPAAAAAGPARGPDPLAVASSLDVLAVCLAAGMAVSTAAAATAPSAPPKLAAGVAPGRRSAGAGRRSRCGLVDFAGVPAGSVDAQTDALLRLARRSASSGAALADGVAELADQSRHDAAHAATAAAERAGVLIAGPLGLCFLPAFVCLGIVPVVAGLAGDVLQSGLL